MAPIISVENVSKLYYIGALQAHAGSIRDALVNLFKRRNGTQSPGKRLVREEVWALKDITFSVEPGEILGLIGSNGAGKSTLLKLLSRITEPTSGRIELGGRIGSLLEVGTGFHPELSGRENIYLNGAILGMRRDEIARKFDEIVSFSEVERFIDTPVKYYSSGMYMRLAFSIAAHLESEVLIVDEVLAVGDAAFQKKCLDKMGEITKDGRTILFVSHNMIAVRSLCRRILWLQHGQLIADGESAKVVGNYLAAQTALSATSEEKWANLAEAPGNASVRIRRVAIEAEDDYDQTPLTMKSSFTIVVEFWNMEPMAQLHITLHLFTAHGIVAFTTGSVADSPWLGRGMPVGLYRCVCHVPGNLLNTGMHRFLVLVIKDRNSVLYQHESAVSFEIHDMEERDVLQYGREPGVVQPILKWTTQMLGAEVTTP